MEHPDYRANLELVLEFTGGKKCLKIRDVKLFTGISDDRTAKRKFPFCGTTITAAAFARALCGERTR